MGTALFFILFDSFPTNLYSIFTEVREQMATQCPKCYTDNPSDSKYCKECATPLPSIPMFSVNLFEIVQLFCKMRAQRSLCTSPRLP
jgi:hypothetical protein